MTDQDRPLGRPSENRRDEEEQGSRVRITDKRLKPRESGGRAEDKPSPAEASGGASPMEEAQQLADERLEQLKRMKADFENFRRRVIREQTELVERSSQRIVERLLPVLDDLERALEAARKHEPDEAIVRGVELVYMHLHEVLVDEGLERLADEGAFDPQDHEAVSSVPSAVPEPRILEIVRPGYKLKGKTIRPALVHVSVPDGSVPADSPEEGGG